jgi:uncharacterized protein YraI
MRRRLLSLLSSVFLAGPVTAQAPVRSHDTLAYTTASVRLREKPFPTARALAALPKGTAVRLYTCSQGWCNVAVSQVAGYYSKSFSARKRRKLRRHRGAATSIPRGSGSHRPRAPRMGSRPKARRLIVVTGRTALVARGRGRARIMAVWHSG